MKQYFLYGLLLAGVLAGCSDDGLDGQGNALPEGEYPLRLSAEVSELRTRAGGKDAWTNGDAVGIRMGDEGQTARYVIGTDNALNPATPDQTLYWRTTDPAVIQSWYPYEAQTNVDISDQSNGYAAFDFLYAEATGSYNQPATLYFKHRMAKVEYTLVAGDGITDADLQAAAVTVYGDTHVGFTEGIVEAADQTDGEITPYKNGTTGGEAIVVPQDMTGKPLLKVSINGNGFIYTPATTTAGNLVAGKRNSYRITVKANGISVAATGGEWNNGGEENVVLTITYQADELKPGDYFYSDGTWSDGGLRKLKADGTYEKTDINPTSGKTCVGLVFHVRGVNSPQDECNYEKFSGLPTGYIVSLDQNLSAWSGRALYGDDQTPADGINGYTYTTLYASKHSRKSLIAIPWCTNHQAIPAGGQAVFSTWYMPSLWEYRLMRSSETGISNAPILDVLESNIASSGGTAFVDGFYSTCGLMGSYGDYLFTCNLKTGSESAPSNSWSTQLYYRAVCAFQLKGQ